MGSSAWRGRWVWLRRWLIVPLLLAIIDIILSVYSPPTTALLAAAPVAMQEPCPLVDTWPAPDRTVTAARLKQEIAAALRPEAAWEQAEAAIRCYDLYKDAPWATEVLTPFLDHYGAQIVVNAQWFSRLHPAWTRHAIATVAPTLPAIVLQELPQLATLDVQWAKRLVEVGVAALPAVVFSHTAVLLVLDRQWAQGVLQEAAKAVPRRAVQAVHTYIAAPWGPALFAEAVLAAPLQVVNLFLQQRPEPWVLLEAMQYSPDPRVQVLAQIVEGPYEPDTKRRMVLFLWDVAEQRMTLADTARLSVHTSAYFSRLVTMQLQHREPGSSTREALLDKEALALVQYLNSLHDRPEAERFRLVAPLTARELYYVLAYGAEESFTSTYRGVFDRLLARMHAEGLTGHQLLEHVQEVRVRDFLKAAALFNRLEAFLATFASPVRRWALLTRLVEHIELTADVAVDAATVADILDAPWDSHSLRLLRDTITREYQRAVRTQHQAAVAVYGLLAARLLPRQAALPHDATFTAIAQRYRPALPTLTELPSARLFPRGRNVQRYFFYPDEDGALSFSSFLAQYRFSRLWHLDDFGPFVRLSATVDGRTMDMYANKPATAEEGTAALDHWLQQQGLHPQVVVHRGHSYYVGHTIAHLPATTVLVFLGSCGGYGRLDAVLKKAPEAHVITTKGIASHTINDPLLKVLNEYLLTGKDVRWEEFWPQAAAVLKQHPQFLDYVPPHRNAGMSFLKAYRTLIQAGVEEPGRSTCQ